MRTALITGASSGIGLELAHVLADEKSDLILVARNKEKLLALAEELKRNNDINIKVIAKDLSKPEEVKALIDEVQNENIQYLINNAGFGYFGAYHECGWKTTQDMMELNMITLAHLTHSLLPKMIERGCGKIINVASVAGFLPGPNMAVYYATKAFVLHFSEAIAQELKGTGVTVTALCPGPTESQFMDVSGMAETKLVKGRKLPTSKQVAEYGYQAMMRGQHVAVHGWGNFILSVLPRLFPRRLTTWVVSLIQKR
jgi:short-subunit dehydrogenase